MMFDGWAASRSVDPLALPLDRMMSLIYWWCARGMDEKHLQQFDARLWIPPEGHDPRGPWSPENETALFQRAKQMTGA